MTSAVGQTSEKESSKTRWVAVFALVIWAFSLILLYPEKANFVLTRSWWHTVLGAILEISVPVLAILELRHSSEANTLRKQANQLRAEAIALEEQNAKLIAQLAEERNKHLQEIAKNTARPITPAEKNAGLLRKHLRATVAVSEGTHVWGNTPEIVEVGEDNTVTLFTASSHMSSNAWCVKLRCEDLEITDIPQGACPLRLTVVKRYGAPVELGEIKKWEERNQPAAVRVFAKGDRAYDASYTKQGSSEKRTLFVYGSKDGANSYLLETSTGSKFIADNVEISKRFVLLEVEYKAEGFTFGGDGSGNTKHPLFIR
jgi:hypothetical protein